MAVKRLSRKIRSGLINTFLDEPARKNASQGRTSESDQSLAGHRLRELEYGERRIAFLQPGAVNGIYETASSKKRQSGQSMIEFAFLMPIVAAVFFLLVQVEMAISTSIVNQKYARAQLMFLFFNHRYLIEERFYSGLSSGIYKRQYFTGIDDKVSDAQTSGSKISPVAPTRKIGSFVPGTDKDAQTEGVPRQNVRIRTLVFTCLAPLGFNLGEQFSENHLEENTFKASRYPYCDGDK